MRACKLIAAWFVTVLTMSGCSKPYKIETLKSPTEGVFYTVETNNGGPGPLASDTVNVYAHLERNGKSTKGLVLSGDSLEISKIIWNTPLDDTICLDGGITDIFHNQVTLILDDSQEDSKTLRNHLDEHCP